MPTYRVYERIESLMVYEVEADDPKDAKEKVETEEYAVSWLDRDYSETLGYSMIEEVITEADGHIELTEVWNESLGYACPTCGQFEDAEGCNCEPVTP